MREGILSKVVDHAPQPILGNFCLERGIIKCITSLGHYMKVMRFLEPTTYKRRATVHSSTCLQHWRKEPWEQKSALPLSLHKMTFIAPSTMVSYPVTIRWTGDNGREYYIDYWATLQQDGRVEGGLAIMEIDITPYMLHINWDLFETAGHDDVLSEGSANQKLIGKRKRVEDDEDGPQAKKMRQGFSPTDDEELRKQLRYSDKGPSRSGGCNEEIEVIDLTTSDSETDEEDDYNNEDDNDDFIDDDDDEDDEDSNSDDEADMNDFFMEMRTDPIYSLRGRALCEWDPD